MNKSETTVFETEAIVFPVEFRQNDQAAMTAEAESAKIVVEKRAAQTGAENRFARLKKSLKKRSASIL